MYLFFTISGFLFVVGSSIILSNLYDLFEVNKVTNFLSPTTDSIYNKISITIIPCIIWSLIEVIVIGNNKYFILGFLLNIFLNFGIIYVIKYGYNLITHENSKFIDTLAIVIAVFFGFLCNYLCLRIGLDSNINILISLFVVIIFAVVFVLIRLYPPKHEFFKGTN